MTQLSPASVLGCNDQPFAGRMWRRDFPHGHFELVYRSMAKAPSELERINTWLATSGSDNRVTAKALYGASGSSLSSTPDLDPETNKERAARRAKQKLRWLIKCIGADRLLTLTFREDVTDYAQAEAVLTKFLRRCRDQWGPKFQFAAVPEIQPERKARTGASVWHFHLALRGYWNIHKLRAFWWRSLGHKVSMSAEGHPVREDGLQALGNVDITSPYVRGQKRRAWMVDRLAAYLAKYVGKTIGQNDLGGSPSYRATRGLHPALARFVVRGLTFGNVAEVFAAEASAFGALPFLFQSPDKQLLWASGVVAPPPVQ